MNGKKEKNASINIQFKVWDMWKKQVFHQRDMENWYWLSCQVAFDQLELQAFSALQKAASHSVIITQISDAISSYEK